MCLPLDVSNTQHMENAPVEIPQRLHYPTLLAPSSHFNRVWNSERPLPTLIFTRAKTTSRVLRFSCMSAKLDQMDCSAKHDNFFFSLYIREMSRFSHFNTLRQRNTNWYDLHHTTNHLLLATKICTLSSHYSNTLYLHHVLFFCLPQVTSSLGNNTN